MLKGINKQIIEIKCTNDELFEKALLFVRSDKADLPQAVFTEHSEELFGAKERTSSRKERSRGAVPLLLMLLSAAILLTACLYVWASFA